MSAPAQEGSMTGAPESFEPPEELFDSDVANATRFANKFTGGVKYTPERGWLFWNGTRWKIDQQGFVVELAKDVARGIFGELQTAPQVQQKAVFSWARQSQRAERLRAMLSLAQSEPGISARWKEFDAKPWLLAVNNGTVDLRTGELRPAAREDKLSRFVPIDYGVDACCPAWDAFLERVQPDPDVRDFLQRAIGYTLTGVTDEQCLLGYSPLRARVEERTGKWVHTVHNRSHPSESGEVSADTFRSWTED